MNKISKLVQAIRNEHQNHNTWDDSEYYTRFLKQMRSQGKTEWITVDGNSVAKNHYLKPYTDSEIENAVKYIVNQNLGIEQPDLVISTATKDNEPRKSKTKSCAEYKGKWNMYNRIIDVELKTLSATAFKIYAVLFRIANTEKKYVLTTTFAYLQKISGIRDIKTVRKSVRELEEHNLIDVVDVGRRGQSTKFRLK